jgi:hypothetical protein
MIQTFVNLLHDVVGPLAYFVMETRVPERMTVLNWGVVHPAEKRRYLFGIVSVGFDHETDDLWKAAIAQIWAKLPKHGGLDEQQPPPPA